MYKIYTYKLCILNIHIPCELPAVAMNQPLSQDLLVFHIFHLSEPLVRQNKNKIEVDKKDDEKL